LLAVYRHVISYVLGRQNLHPSRNPTRELNLIVSLECMGAG